MSLQDDVNEQVVAIHGSLDAASSAAGALGGLIGGIGDQQINNDPIVTALDAIRQAVALISQAFDVVADAIDAIELTPGPAGDAATIAIGSVGTLAPGSQATVENVGSTSEAVFNFGIPAGIPGEGGGGATISIGSVQTLAPGSQATVENVGSPSEAVFNFGIPAGVAGEPGSSGSGISFGDPNPNDEIFLNPPDLYFQTTSPHKVWKRVGGGTPYEDIT